MYFENVCKINNNGKLSGYHQRGKYDKESNNITYFINNRYGDENDLKHFSLTHQNPLSLFDTFDPFAVFNPFSRPAKQTPKSIMNDNDFLQYCEQRRKDNIYKQHHQEIKKAIRGKINEQLDTQGFVEDGILDDFRFVVEHENNSPSEMEQQEKEIWEALNGLYCGAHETHDPTQETQEATPQ